jgi:ATP-dependent DNA ligase
LFYTGRAGTGIDEAELKRLLGKLKPLEVKKMALSEPRRGRTASARR